MPQTPRQVAEAGTTEKKVHLPSLAPWLGPPWAESSPRQSQCEEHIRFGVRWGAAGAGLALSVLIRGKKSRMLPLPPEQCGFCVGCCSVAFLGFCRTVAPNWGPRQQDQHHLQTCWKCSFLAPSTRDGLGRGRHSVFPQSPPGDSDGLMLVCKVWGGGGGIARFTWNVFGDFGIHPS